jgi:hypothetical protein
MVHTLLADNVIGEANKKYNTITTSDTFCKKKNSVPNAIESDDLSR